MAEQPRDWDKELADIDKLIGAAPPAPPALPAGPRPSEGRAAGPSAAAPGVPAGRRATVPPWLRALLGVVLVAAMTQWPYAHRCGLGTILYLGASGGVVLAGLWAAVGSWRRHAALTHVVGLGVILAGLVFAALEVLPRIGYARTALPWMCE